MSAHTPEEVKAAAEKLSDTILKVVDAVVSQMEIAASLGEDPNKLRDVARDLLMEKAGFSQVQAANIVRLAVQKFNAKHAGLDTYGRSGIRTICERIAGIGPLARF
jgi:hypothetical protein